MRRRRKGGVGTRQAPRARRGREFDCQSPLWTTTNKADGDTDMQLLQTGNCTEDGTVESIPRNEGMHRRDQLEGVERPRVRSSTVDVETSVHAS